MKKIFKILPFCFLLALISCGDHENPVYQGDVNNFTFLSFDKTLYDLPIAIDSEGSVTIPLNVSALSSADRTYTLELIGDDSTADPLTYNLPATVTIPANEYAGNIVISGQDLGLVETTAKVFSFKITGLSEKEFMDTSVVTVRVFEVCPIEEGKFVGNYLLEEMTPFVDGPTLDHGQVVQVTMTTPTGRTFMTRNYPNYCAPLRAFNFSLVCNEVIVDANQSSTCQCTTAGLFFGPATTPATYDADNDAVFYITFTNDVTGDCSSPVQTTYKLTKQ